MDNRTRLRRLKMLKDMLLKHDEYFPEAKFDITVWVGEDGVQKLDCGTAACALGSACFYKPFNKLGLRMHERGWPVYMDEDGDIHDSLEAAVHFFGIRYFETKWLFMPRNYVNKKGEYYSLKTINKYVTPEVVAKRVDILMESYRRGGTGLNPDELDLRAGL